MPVIEINITSYTKILNESECGIVHAIKGDVGFYISKSEPTASLVNAPTIKKGESVAFADGNNREAIWMKAKTNLSTKIMLNLYDDQVAAD